MKKIDLFRSRSTNAETTFKSNSCYMEGIELICILILLAIGNIHLITGHIADALVYFPSTESPNRWARLFLHPFVHVSWYHFLLDAGAFLLLYFGLDTKSASRRTVYVLISAVTSFTTVILFSKNAIIPGFCGLSGIAHGLMAIYGLEMASSKTNRMAAFLVLNILVLKCGVELISDQAVFAFLHFGQCGQPIPESHAGGILGGFLGFLIFNIFSEKLRISQQKTCLPCRNGNYLGDKSLFD